MAWNRMEWKGRKGNEEIGEVRKKRKEEEEREEERERERRKEKE